MNNSKLEIIRKLLAKAESTTFEGERDAYTAKATAMIAEYGIDEALLDAQDVTRSTVGVRTFLIEPDYAKDKAEFLHRIYSPLGCKAINLGQDRVTRVITMKVFGYDSDLDRAEILYTSLLIQVLAEMARVPSAGHQRTTAANRRRVMDGFGTAVHFRLRAAEKVAADTVASEGTSTALVLVDRQEAVQSAYDTAYPNAVKSARRNLTGRGFGAGYAAGQRADIGHKRVGNRRTSIGA